MHAVVSNLGGVICCCLLNASPFLVCRLVRSTTQVHRASALVKTFAGVFRRGALAPDFWATIVDGYTGERMAVADPLVFHFEHRVVLELLLRRLFTFPHQRFLPKHLALQIPQKDSVRRRWVMLYPELIANILRAQHAACPKVSGPGELRVRTHALDGVDANVLRRIAHEQVILVQAEDV